MNTILLILNLLTAIAAVTATLILQHRDAKRKRRQIVYQRLNCVSLTHLLVAATALGLSLLLRRYGPHPTAICCTQVCCIGYAGLWALKVSGWDFSRKLFRYLIATELLLSCAVLALPFTAKWIAFLAAMLCCAVTFLSLYKSFDRIMSGREKRSLEEMLGVNAIALIVLCTSGSGIVEIAITVLECHFFVRYSTRFKPVGVYVQKPVLPAALPSHLGDEGRDQREVIKDRLITYLTESKVYLQNEVRITDIASSIYTNKTYLSKVIKECLNRNFSQVIHYFRVQEAIEMYMKEPTLSAQELCDKSGFNSMSSFSNAFKINTGLTPGLWCKEYQKKLKMNDDEE